METKDITSRFENNEQANWVRGNFGSFLDSQTPDFRDAAIRVAKKAYWTTQEDCGYSGQDSIGISSLVTIYGNQAKEFAKLLCIRAPYQETLSSVRLSLGA